MVWFVSGSAMPVRAGSLADNSVGNQEGQAGNRVDGAEATGGTALPRQRPWSQWCSGHCCFRRGCFTLPPAAHSRFCLDSVGQLGFLCSQILRSHIPQHSDSCYQPRLLLGLSEPQLLLTVPELYCRPLTSDSCCFSTALPTRGTNAQGGGGAGFRER